MTKRQSSNSIRAQFRSERKEQFNKHLAPEHKQTPGAQFVSLCRCDFKPVVEGYHAVEVAYPIIGFGKFPPIQPKINEIGDIEVQGRYPILQSTLSRATIKGDFLLLRVLGHELVEAGGKKCRAKR